jgi:hypothetical protein
MEYEIIYYLYLGIIKLRGYYVDNGSYVANSSAVPFALRVLDLLDIATRDIHIVSDDFARVPIACVFRFVFFSGILKLSGPSRETGKEGSAIHCRQSA